MSYNLLGSRNFIENSITYMGIYIWLTVIFSILNSVKGVGKSRRRFDTVRGDTSSCRNVFVSLMHELADQRKWTTFASWHEHVANIKSFSFTWKLFVLSFLEIAS